MSLNTVVPAALWIALVALAVEAAFGYPAALFNRSGHPVTWIGRVIAALDRAFNSADRSFAWRRFAGVAALLILLALVGLVALVVQLGLEGLFGVLALPLTGLLASSLLAQRSLHQHVVQVAAGLEAGLAEGRRAVSQIVGRDPDTLDEAAVARAAIESLAENFSDGVVAPLLYTAVGGLPGGALYKAVNTADSMIGHRTPQHKAFGWAAARLDDLVNLPASRLAALWIVAAAALLPGCDPKAAWVAVRRDARHHRSPNAGWPEAAMAGALGLRLAGPRVYGGVTVEDRWMGEGRAAADAGDIRRALRVYRTACLVQAATLAVLVAAWRIAAS